MHLFKGIFAIGLSLFFSSLLHAGVSCRFDAFEDIISLSPEVSRDTGAQRVIEFNNADGVIHFYLAGPKLSEKQKKELAEYLDYVNDNIIDYSEKLSRPEKVLLFASLTGQDAFWSKPGRWQLKTIYQFTMTLNRAGYHLRAVQKKIEKAEQKAAKLAEQGKSEEANAVVRKEQEFTVGKHPIFSRAITQHEYGHVMFDALLAANYPIMKSMQEVTIATTEVGLRIQRVQEEIALLYEKMGQKDFLEFKEIVELLFMEGGKLLTPEQKTRQKEFKTLITGFGKEEAAYYKFLEETVALVRKTEKDLVDRGYEIMFGEAYNPMKAAGYKAERTALKQKTEKMTKELEQALGQYYEKHNELKVQFESKEIFIERMKRYMGEEFAYLEYEGQYGQTLMRDLANLQALGLRREAAQAELKVLDLKIDRDPEVLMQVAMTAPKVAHRLISQYHEFFADVVAVLSNKNKGDSIYRGLFHTSPNKFVGGGREKSFNDRDFTNKDNRIDRWVPTTAGHQFYAPTRYFLNQYLKQPRFQKPELKGKLIDAILAGMHNVLDPMLNTSQFFSAAHLKQYGLLRVMNDIKTEIVKEQLDQMFAEYGGEKAIKLSEEEKKEVYELYGHEAMKNLRENNFLLDNLGGYVVRTEAVKNQHGDHSPGARGGHEVIEANQLMIDSIKAEIEKAGLE